LKKAVEDSNVFVARIKCENECGFYWVIEAADWLSAVWRSTESQRNR